MLTALPVGPVALILQNEASLVLLSLEHLHSTLSKSIVARILELPHSMTIASVLGLILESSSLSQFFNLNPTDCNRQTMSERSGFIRICANYSIIYNFIIFFF